jgi:ComF family protein
MDLLHPLKLLRGIFYPQVCNVCGRWLVHGESEICLHCTDELPKTYYHQSPQNPVTKIFWGRQPLTFATSFLHFAEKGKVQQILHLIKYRGKKQLATELGKILTADLMAANPLFTVDFVVPVPLHARKQKQRGYNQAEYFANGIAEICGARVLPDLLQRNHYRLSQTKKSRFARWQNVQEEFSIKNLSVPKNAKIVLVDDVVTTGATAEACLVPLFRAGFSNVGFISLAYASG